MPAEVATYIDTSALAKWYVREPGSDAFETWIRSAASPTVSSLTIVEMRCLLARRRRDASLDGQAADTVFRVLNEHVETRLLAVESVADGDVRAAVHLLGRIDEHPLRALDAIHLTICTSRGISRLATADAVMAAAAADLGLAVVRFDGS